ncbi:MAG: hypothetical protein AB8C40_08985 [Gammaproteobacteria bacterium]
MNKDSDQISIQIQIPNRYDNIDEPTLVLTEVKHDCNVNVPLDDVFDQILQSYQNDPEALHRFSYYLLLQAKAFAQSEGVSEKLDKVNLEGEESS